MDELIKFLNDNMIDPLDNDYFTEFINKIGIVFINDEEGWGKSETSKEALNLASINNWLPLPSASESWEDYNRAANNNCYLKFDDGSECRYNDMDWNFAKVTHYRHVE